MVNTVPVKVKPSSSTPATMRKPVCPMLCSGAVRDSNRVGVPDILPSDRTLRVVNTPKTPLHGSAAQPRRARLMSRSQAEAFLLALAQANPAPETELAYGDAFSLLVAVVLSAQATDASVNKVTPALFAAAPTPAAMAPSGPRASAR
jgi:hypothetical protein